MSDYKTTGKLNAAGIAKLMNSDNIVLDLDDAKIASIESGTRKNIVPQLNLSTLSHPIKPVEPEYNGNSSKRKESISNS